MTIVTNNVKGYNIKSLNRHNGSIPLLIMCLGHDAFERDAHVSTRETYLRLALLYIGRNINITVSHVLSRIYVQFDVL